MALRGMSREGASSALLRTEGGLEALSNRSRLHLELLPAVLSLGDSRVEKDQQFLGRLRAAGEQCLHASQRSVGDVPDRGGQGSVTSVVLGVGIESTLDELSNDGRKASAVERCLTIIIDE